MNKMTLTAVAALTLAAGSFTGCATAEMKQINRDHAAAMAEIEHPSPATQAANRAFFNSMIHYYEHMTPQERAARAAAMAQRQAAWNQQQIVSNQEIMIANQRKAMEQQKEFQEQQQRDADWNSFEQRYQQQQPHYYQGTVDENGNAQLYGY